MKRRASLIPLLLGLLLAQPAAAGEKPKRQVVDLKKLDIEGSIPNPATMFIHERNSGGLLELFPLKRELAGEWLPPVDKGSFDHVTVNLVDSRKI